MIATAKQRDAIAGRIGWAKANLFNSRANTALTLISLGAAAVILALAFRYVLFQANWALVALNRRLFFIGSYPADETARIWIAVFLVASLIALTYGIWAGRLRPYLIVVGVVATIILTLGIGTEMRIEERQFTEVIESAAGQTTNISGINRVPCDGMAGGRLHGCMRCHSGSPCHLARRGFCWRASSPRWPGEPWLAGG